MKQIKSKFLIAGALIMGCLSTKAVQVIDVVEAPTGFFVPTDGQKYDAPYYRWWDEDWGWTHSPLPQPYTTAKLLISAFDVDFPDEMDIVSVVNGAPIVLGSLTGLSDQWSFAEFDVTAYAAEIAAGLQVWIDIDSSHSSDTWALTLAKSVLTLDGAQPPPPPPGQVPDGGLSALLLALGATGVGGARKWMRS